MERQWQYQRPKTSPPVAGFESALFQSEVECANHWTTDAPIWDNVTLSELLCHQNYHFDQDIVL